MKKTSLLVAGLCAAAMAWAQPKTMHQLQQEFEDLKFGMFNHYGLPTYVEADWSDPDQSPEIIVAPKFDCRQWARAARSAHMAFGCLSVKHHNGLCLWDTETTDYSTMHSPLGRDVVREYCDAFRSQGMKIMFHFSILDTHHRLRPHKVTPQLVEMTKRQLSELLTRYGDITAIIFDGWDAPWGRISYEEVSFPEIYRLIKSLQPNCLVIDMNSHKFPAEELFYSDIKFYEQGAGQMISTETNRLPAMACLPMQRTWFWKQSMPGESVRDGRDFVENVLIPYNKAYCCFVLNAAPKRDGLIDDNAVAELKRIGKIWKPTPSVAIPQCEEPITQANVAKNRPSESSWSDDTSIMDYANDDDYRTCWRSMPGVKNPFWEVELGCNKAIDMIVLTEPKGGVIQEYRLQYRTMAGKWQTLFEGTSPTDGRVKIHRFEPVIAAYVRITITRSQSAPAIAELGVYAAR